MTALFSKPKAPTLPPPPPPPPTIDDAAMRDEWEKKTLRRRSRFRNIYSSPGEQPSVKQTKLG